MVERHGRDPDKREEAANLAREAVDELRHGDREEGQFLAEEARELDAAAAEAVLKQPDKAERPAGKAAKSGGGKSGGSKKSKSGAGSTRAHPAHEGGHAAERTTDHDAIRAWVEERNGRPSVVTRSHDAEEGGGILRIDFDEPESSLEEVPWDEFFQTFEDRQLAFLHQDRTADGKVSRFFKFVRREQGDR